MAMNHHRQIMLLTRVSSNCVMQHGVQGHTSGLEKKFLRQNVIGKSMNQ